MLSLTFYSKTIYWQIIIDVIFATVLAFTLYSIFNNGNLEKRLLPNFSFIVAIGLIFRTIYLIITMLKSMVAKNWKLFLGCLFHLLIVGSMFYMSLFLILLSLGAFGGGPGGH